MRRAASLARTAAEEAGRRPEGRPLAAAHADVSWPDGATPALWHAQSILREFRGDGHVALLVVHGLSGIESLVTHAAAGDVPAPRAAHLSRLVAGANGRRRSTRCAGGAGSREVRVSASPIGAVPSDVRSRMGTDALAAAPYAALGDDGCAELRALARPWSTVFAGQLPR